MGYDLDKSAGVFPPGIMLPGSPSAKLMAQYKDQKIKVFANCPEEYNKKINSIQAFMSRDTEAWLTEKPAFPSSGRRCS
jgi:hypothetical protein